MHAKTKGLFETAFHAEFIFNYRVQIKVAPKGQAATLGVRTGWRLTDISLEGRRGVPEPLFSVTATSTSKEALEALAAARKRGKPYTLGFSLAENLSFRSGHDGGGQEPVDHTNSRPGREEDVVGATATRDVLEGSCADATGEGMVEEQHVEVKGQGVEEPKAQGALAGGGAVVGDGDVQQAEALVSGGGVVGEEGGRGDGQVTLMYEMYDEKFPIKVKFVF